MDIFKFWTLVGEVNLGLVAHGIGGWVFVFVFWNDNFGLLFIAFV
jgi:hypothetical protein